MELHVRRAELADAPSIASVEIESWRSTYGGIVPDERLRRMSFAEHLASWTQSLSGRGSSTFVGLRALDPGQEAEVCAFASGGRDRSGNEIYRGELFVIYLLREVQRQGLGRRLVAAVAEDLRGDGITSMRVWALERNPFCRFYASLGGVPAGRRTITIGGRSLDIVAYGWPDTSELRATLTSAS